MTQNYRACYMAASCNEGAIAKSTDSVHQCSLWAQCRLRPFVMLS